ncbi:helix-turn-helix transcriptional regulator [Bacillus sp. B-jedd]|uniref:helix-turn-helix transcriptional regulator n=1 Tax=Bacillus sp. B-jedd TaxID=1476857 RepID=UPI00051557C7|nr:helix-turn-helix domain-containing protein [Bacillus sp. B-jedd]CEG25967.1 XRE family transcriptional regulator [Bacillus sp. B-jedd]
MENIVKYLRKSRDVDLTQEELATAIGVSRHTIISIENGGNTTGEVMLKIANFFNKDPREIFFIESVAQKEQAGANSS